MADSFSTFSPGLDSPCGYAEAVTPSDTVSLTISSRALYIGGAGNLTVLTVGGQTVTFTGVLAGSIIPIRVSRVNATVTTATSIVSIS